MSLRSSYFALLLAFGGTIPDLSAQELEFPISPNRVGSGARAAMIEAMQTHGADSFPARVASVMQGSTETTLYVLAVYCGAVGISKIRYAMTCGLLADAAGITAAIFISYAFFG